MARIAFIGMGEAGSALVTGWGRGVHAVTAFDIRTDSRKTRSAMLARYAELGVEGCGSLDRALSGAHLVISVVTADQAVAAARTAAPYLERGAFFCDLNSCAPSSKRISAIDVDGAGAHYVDVAVMSPVHPKLNLVPLLLSGPHAAGVAPILEALPMNLRVIEGGIGRASTIKMVRSVLVKGLEALTAEFFLAVEAAGIADEVLPTLAPSFPGFDWERQGRYNLERAMVHGSRRAAEMVEVGKTLEDLGLPSGVSAAAAEWEWLLSAVPVEPPTGSGDDDVMALAAGLLPHIRSKPSI